MWFDTVLLGFIYPVWGSINLLAYDFPNLGIFQLGKEVQLPPKDPSLDARKKSVWGCHYSNRYTFILSTHLFFKGRHHIKYWRNQDKNSNKNNNNNKIAKNPGGKVAYKLSIISCGNHVLLVSATKAIRCTVWKRLEAS